MPTFYEFFAGGGMARAGLGPAWTCLFANDFDDKKATSYVANWGNDDLWVGDVANVTVAQLPATADLAWASFPCQDLSLAGSGAGLKGERSGTFWSFWNQMTKLRAEGRAPTTVVLENVYGALTSNCGLDFSAIITALSDGGYRPGAVVVNAAHFIPQSRPRLFVIGVRDDIEIDRDLVADGPENTWHPQALCAACRQFSEEVKARWQWWNLPVPATTDLKLSDLVEEEPTGVKWHSASETDRLLGMMDKTNIEKVRSAKRTGRRMVGTVYKRTRANGPERAKVQRAEVRFDNVAGCLRTPGGGSSRQTLIIVDGETVQSRLLSPREAARLMGLPDTYILPERYNDAYHLTGDGVVVPVVRFLADCILEPILLPKSATTKKAA